MLDKLMKGIQEETTVEGGITKILNNLSNLMEQVADDDYYPDAADELKEILDHNKAKIAEALTANTHHIAHVGVSDFPSFNVKRITENGLGVQLLSPTKIEKEDDGSITIVLSDIPAPLVQAALMRAKMRIASTESLEQGGPAGAYELLEFSAVPRNEGYPEDGSDENNTYAKWTPSAYLKMYVTNPDLFGKFKKGQEFYVNFIAARKDNPTNEELSKCTACDWKGPETAVFDGSLCPACGAPVVPEAVTKFDLARLKEDAPDTTTAPKVPELPPKNAPKTKAKTSKK